MNIKNLHIVHNREILYYFYKYIYKYLYLFRSGAGTTGGSGSRAGTPSRGSSSTTTDRSSVLAESDRRRDIRNHAISPIGNFFRRP